MMLLGTCHNTYIRAHTVCKFLCTHTVGPYISAKTNTHGMTVHSGKLRSQPQESSVSEAENWGYSVKRLDPEVMATLTIDHFHLLMYGDSDYWGRTPILQPEQPLWKIPPLCWYCQALYHKQQRTHSTELQLSSQLPTAVGLQKVLLCFLTQSHTYIHATSNNMTSQRCSTHHVRDLAQKHICKPQHGKWSLESTLRASRSEGEQPEFILTCSWSK